MQNTLLESFAQLKELEVRAGIVKEDESLGEVRVLSVSGWPAHDLLMLVRDDLEMPLHSEISGLFGKHRLNCYHRLCLGAIRSYRIKFSVTDRHNNSNYVGTIRVRI